MMGPASLGSASLGSASQNVDSQDTVGVDAELAPDTEPDDASQSEVKQGPVEIWVIVGTLHGCDKAIVDDPKRMSEVLDQCTKAGGVTLLHSHIHRFEPQGITASAVLAESHIALHSWPDQGVLFFDIATCSSSESSHAVYRELCRRVPHTTEKIRELTVD